MCCCLFFYKQKTAYEVRISDLSSGVCSSDLGGNRRGRHGQGRRTGAVPTRHCSFSFARLGWQRAGESRWEGGRSAGSRGGRSEEHTSELQSLMRNSYAVFCLKKRRDGGSSHS